MKQYGNTIVIGIDHGYGNLKTANTVTTTGIAEYKNRPAFDADLLEIDGKFYKIGEGHKYFIPDKTADNDFYLMTLAAVAKEMQLAGITSGNVHLAVGLPLTWVKNQRETFRRYMLQNQSVCFTYNCTEYKINVVGCSVFPQGYTAVIEHLPEMNGVNMIADIGNGTLNIMYIENKKPIENKCYTEKLGVEQCVTACKNALRDIYGVEISDSTITEIIMTGAANIGEKYLNVIVSECKAYYEKIMETLKRYNYDPGLMRLYVCGGGACIFKNFGNPENAMIINDICSAAKGYENLAYSLLKKNG